MTTEQVNFNLSHASAMIKAVSHGFFTANEWSQQPNATMEDCAIAFKCLKQCMEEYDAVLTVAAKMIDETNSAIDKSNTNN